jgi:hypothetical protein
LPGKIDKEGRFSGLLRPLLCVLWLPLFLFLPRPAFARAKAEAPGELLNKDWVLCVTAFDTSTLSPERRTSGEVLIKELAKNLSVLGRRFRPGEEMTYYLDYAWTRSRAEAAKALGAKRNERDALIYRGDPEWKYKKSIKTIDEEIVKLEETLAALNENLPRIEGIPAFKFADSNADGAFPAPPKEGGEYLFCVNQKADGFLKGKAVEYYGRLYLTIGLYTRYSRSYIYEDSIIFSPDDLGSAATELSGRLSGALSSSASAVIAVHSTPEDALVLLDGAFAGRGEAPAREHTPGEVAVSASAEHYLSQDVKVRLKPGELTEVFINLTPVGLAAFDLAVPENPGSAAYMGALYLGETPLRVTLPENQFAYLGVETPEGRVGQAIVRGARPVRGRAEFIQAHKEEGYEQDTLALATRVSIAGTKRVDTARRRFYGSYGRFWIIMPLAFMSIGVARNYIDAYSSNPNPGMEDYDKAVAASYVRPIAWGVLGLGISELVFRIWRYLYFSASDASPLAR